MPQYIENIAAKKITANMTTLATAINTGVTTLVFTHNVFTTPVSITIGGETISLGSTANGGYTWTGCTRAGSPESHAAGQEVYLAAGTEFLTHTFDGDTFFSALAASANNDWTLGIVVDDVLKERIPRTLYDLSYFRPYHYEKPTIGKKLALVAWLSRTNGEEMSVSGAFQA